MRTMRKLALAWLGDEIAKLLQEKPELKLKIVGHTDNKGTPEYNLDRAAAQPMS
jgi:outer membrane protein OmpA-like peptidoglycan-associated protein